MNGQKKLFRPPVKLGSVFWRVCFRRRERTSIVRRSQNAYHSRRVKKLSQAQTGRRDTAGLRKHAGEFGTNSRFNTQASDIVTLNTLLVTLCPCLVRAEFLQLEFAWVPRGIPPLHVVTQATPSRELYNGRCFELSIGCMFSIVSRAILCPVAG